MDFLVKHLHFLSERLRTKLCELLRSSSLVTQLYPDSGDISLITSALCRSPVKYRIPFGPVVSPSQYFNSSSMARLAHSGYSKTLRGKDFPKPNIDLKKEV